LRPTTALVAGGYFKASIKKVNSPDLPEARYIAKKRLQDEHWSIRIFLLRNRILAIEASIFCVIVFLPNKND